MDPESELIFIFNYENFNPSSNNPIFANEKKYREISITKHSDTSPAMHILMHRIIAIDNKRGQSEQIKISHPYM